MSNHTASFVRRILLVAICVVGAGSSISCNVMGWAATAAAEETKPGAKYVLQKRPTVVIAENFGNPAEASMDADAISRYVTDELNAHQVAPLIDPGKTYALQSANAERWRGLTIAAVGRELEAEQVIYIKIERTALETEAGTDMTRGRGQVRVRVVDSKTGATLWPTEEAQGHVIAADTRQVRGDQMAVSETTVRAELHRALASRTARLFYGYTESD